MNLSCGRVGGGLGRHTFLCNKQNTVTGESVVKLLVVLQQKNKSLSTKMDLYGVFF